MKILLADDHAMVRAGLRLLLARLFADAEINEADDYRQALQALSDHNDYSLILIDRDMPYRNDSEGLHAICQRVPHIPVIVLSASEHPAHIRAALACGARGYLPKNTDASLMFSALQLVLCGGTYLPMALMQHITVPEQNCTAPTKDNLKQKLPTLTARQHEVIKRIARGRTNKEIAREFAISPATVRTHVHAIFRALAVSNRTEAVHVAGKLQLITHPDE